VIGAALGTAGAALSAGVACCICGFLFRNDLGGMILIVDFY